MVCVKRIEFWKGTCTKKLGCGTGRNHLILKLFLIWFRIFRDFNRLSGFTHKILVTPHTIIKFPTLSNLKILFNKIGYLSMPADYIFNAYHSSRFGLIRILRIWVRHMLRRKCLSLFRATGRVPGVLQLCSPRPLSRGEQLSTLTQHWSHSQVHCSIQHNSQFRQSWARDNCIAWRQWQRHNVIELHWREKILEVLRPWCLDKVAATSTDIRQ